MQGDGGSGSMWHKEQFEDAAVEVAALGGSAPAALAVGLRDADGGWDVLAHPEDGVGRRFEIGSVSKALTGSLLGVLVASGDVDPDQPVDDAYGERLPWRGDIPTLVDLATHRSGLPNTPRQLYVREAATALGFSTKDPWRGVTEPAYRTLLASAVARARTDRRFRYSSMGVGLLGDTLARATGTPLDELMRTRLLQPLGMNRTGFDRPADGPDAVERPRNAKGAVLPYLNDWMPAAGMYASCLDDLRRLVGGLLGDGPQSIVEGLRIATTPHHVIDAGVQLGLCWFLGGGHERLIEHTGGTWGSQAQVTLHATTGRAVIALTATPRRLDTFVARYLDGEPEGTAR